MADNNEPTTPPPNEHIGGETSDRSSARRACLIVTFGSIHRTSSPYCSCLLAVKDILVFVLTSLTYLLFMVVLAILFAYLINPLVKAIHRPFQQGRFAGAMPRPVAIAFAFLLFLAYWRWGSACFLRKLVNRQKPCYKSSKLHLVAQFRDQRFYRTTQSDGCIGQHTDADQRADQRCTGCVRIRSHELSLAHRRSLR